MKKQISYILIFLLLPMSTVFGAPAITGKPIELTFAHTNPPITAPAVAAADWAKEVEKLSGGKVKITFVWGGGLLKGPELFDGVKKGIADLGYYVFNMAQGLHLNFVTQLPFLGFTSRTSATEIYRKLTGKFPQLNDEWQGLKPLGTVVMAPSHLMTTKKVVRNLGDFKGLKIQSEGFLLDTVFALGAVPVQLHIADWYMSLDKGLIDGVATAFGPVTAFRILPLLKNLTIFGAAGINMGTNNIIMNLKSYNNLPPDIQKIINDTAHIFGDRFMELSTADDEKGIEQAKKAGHVFTYLSNQEITPWREIASRTLHDKWIKDGKAKGLPAEAVYNEMVRLIQESQKK
jgi:TRAP-type C4-dicarboxylate transport system substrate-binding protein